MTTETRKHIDDGAPLRWYAKEVICACPNCGGAALIRGDVKYAAPLFHFEEARVQCLGCSFCKDWSSPKESWGGPLIGWARQPCPNCGYRWLTVEVSEKRYNDQVNKTAKAQCESCQQTSEVNLSWWMEEHTGKPLDPYFGFPLWLQIYCAGNTLWAYNKDHLNTLKSYVAATQRVRGQGGKWSMLNRLPKWVKSAKNRGSVLKAIGRLEEKLGELKR